MYQDSVYEGYLTKSPPKMSRKWQRRYFVLLPNKKLLYFSKLAGEMKGTIDLTRLQEILFDLYLDKGPSNVMSLDVKGAPELTPKSRGCQDRIFYLLADSREEMETWHGHIMEVAELQLCRKKNVVADSTQGEEYYISARRKTAIQKEELRDRRGLAQSMVADPGMSADFGTYQTSAELSQSIQDNSFGLYDVGHAKMLTDISEITISQGEESSSEDDVCYPPSPEKFKRPKSPIPRRGMTVRESDKHSPYAAVDGSMSLPLSVDEDSPPAIPPHREDLYPQSLDLSPPLPPQRDRSLSKFSPLSSVQDEQKGITRDRKPRSTRNSSKSFHGEVNFASQKRPAAKLPSIPLDVFMTTVKEIPTHTPIPRPRRPSSATSQALSVDTPLSPVGITPYRTVERASELFPDPGPLDAPDPSYVNVDTSHGIYVKFNPGPSSDESEGNYVSISRDPLPLEKIAAGTDASGYSKIVEPKPRTKVSLPPDRSSFEANYK